MSTNERSSGDSGNSMDNRNGEGDMRNPDSEPEVEDEEKEVDGEFGKVEVLDTEREKTTDLDFQHCKIPKIENLEDLPALERLGFRWNFIKTIENVSHLTALQVTTQQLRDQNRES